LFQFTDLAAFVSCPGVDMAAACQSQLCLGYCGPGHFAQAPLCCAYDEQYCGPSVADPAQVRCGGEAAAPDASVAKPTPNDAGISSPLATGVSAGGCACTMFGRSRSTPVASALLAALLSISVLCRLPARVRRAN
jgi:hypothetical protein